jgi:hypothetical protein
VSTPAFVHRLDADRPLPADQGGEEAKDADEPIPQVTREGAPVWSGGVAGKGFREITRRGHPRSDGDAVQIVRQAVPGLAIIRGDEWCFWAVCSSP